MLISGRYFRGNPLIKPKQWGSISAVRTASLDWFERNGINAPTAHYPLWESGGLTAYDLAGKNDGALTGNPQWSSGELYLDGSGDYIQIAHADEFDFTGGGSISLWVHLNSAQANWFGLISKGDTANDWAYGRNSSGNNGRWYTATNYDDLANGISNLIASKRTNVILTFSSTAVKIYYNAAEVFATSTAGLLITTHTASRPVRIGASRDSIGMGGFIDNATFFSNTLTPAQIATLYEQPYAALQPRSIPFYSFPVATGGTTISAEAADGISFSDASTRSAIYRAISSDGLSFSDSDTSRANLTATGGDGLTFADQVTLQALLMALAADGIVFSDESLGSVFLRIAALAEDGMIFSDAAVNSASLKASAADGVLFSDAVSKLLSAVATASDGITFSDSTSWAGIISALAEDGIVFTDTASKLLHTFVTAADGIVLSDAGTVSATFSVSASDAVNFSDTVSSIARLYAALSDGISFSDTATGLNVTFLPNGELTISFSVRQASFSFTIKKPGLAITSRMPTINITKG